MFMPSNRFDDTALMFAAEGGLAYPKGDKIVSVHE